MIPVKDASLIARCDDPALRREWRRRLVDHDGEDAQQALLKALEFKCDVLWAMLDALYHAYVAPKHIPPGAFVPEEGRSG